MDPFEEMHFLLKMGIIHFLVKNGFKGRILNYPVILGGAIWSQNHDCGRKGAGLFDFLGCI